MPFSIRGQQRKSSIFQRHLQLANDAYKMQNVMLAPISQRLPHITASHVINYTAADIDGFVLYMQSASEHHFGL